MKLVLSSSLTFVLLISGCNAMRNDAALSADMAAPRPAATPAAIADSDNNQRLTGGVKPAVAQAKAGEYLLTEPTVSVTTDRKIIRNGEFTIETRNPTEDQHKIQAIAESLGGFVVTSEFKQSSVSVSTVNVIVRVPAAQFQAATDKIRGIGNRILHGKVSGQDVTEEYVDLEAQLRAKKALEAQFLEIMKQARKVEDALSVQEKLSEVRTEIERLEGRRRYLENQAALSTINITLQTPAPLVAASQTGFWASIRNSVGDGVDVTVSIVLGVIHFVIVMLPVVTLILLPGGLLLRYCWRRFGWQRFFKKEVASPQPEA